MSASSIFASLTPAVGLKLNLNLRLGRRCLAPIYILIYASHELRWLDSSPSIHRSTRAPNLHQFTVHSQGKSSVGEELSSLLSSSLFLPYSSPLVILKIVMYIIGFANQKEVTDCFLMVSTAVIFSVNPC